MLRKDKRSMLLSLVIGDGCLHYHHRGAKTYAGLTIAHSPKQADYIAWKAKLIGSILGREINLRTTSNAKGFGTNSEAKLIQIAASWKRFKAWRKFIYPKGKKDKSLILRFITNPDFLMAIWLMDDGYVEGRIDQKHNRCYTASLRIFVSDQSIDSCNRIIAWIKKQYGFEVKLRMQKHRGKSYPFLKICAFDSLKLWDTIRSFVLQFKSMQTKFRFLEMRYQHKLLLAHHTPKSDDIVSAT